MKRTYHFPVASHSYFRASNRDEERERFIASSGTYLPRFSYPGYFNDATVSERYTRTEAGTYAQHSLALVRSSLLLQKDDSELEHFRFLNTELFGVPDEKYAQRIIARMLDSVRDGCETYQEEIKSLLPGVMVDKTSIGPTKDVFLTYKSYFDTYSGDRVTSKMNIVNAVATELTHTKLTDDGWTVELVDDSSHARVYHHDKKVIVGNKYVVRSPESATRIAVHEVYGHALRGHQASVAESEGFAILLEQLLDDTFKPRRMFRYLAACIGWGVFGSPKTFKETYEIIWRLMMIVTKYSETEAKSYAFDECYRVYRGGRVDLPGAVYLKDTVYFTANMKMWDLLSNNKLSYNEFIDVIEGRRALLI